MAACRRPPSSARADVQPPQTPPVPFGGGDGALRPLSAGAWPGTSLRWAPVRTRPDTTKHEERGCTTDTEGEGPLPETPSVHPFSQRERPGGGDNNKERRSSMRSHPPPHPPKRRGEPTRVAAPVVQQNIRTITDTTPQTGNSSGPDRCRMGVHGTVRRRRVGHGREQTLEGRHNTDERSTATIDQPLPYLPSPLPSPPLPPLFPWPGVTAAVTAPRAR